MRFAVILIALTARAACTAPEVTPRAVEQMPDDALVEEGHYWRALRVIQPTTPHNLLLLSKARMNLNDLDAALRDIGAALDAEPDNPAFHLQAAAVEGEMAQKASLFKKLDHAGKAKKELDTAAKLDPANAQARWGLAMFYFAAPAMLGGDKTKAAMIAESLGPYYAARYATEAGDTAKAEQLYKQALLDDPLSFDTAAALSDLTHQEKWACLAVHIDPLRPDGWARLAALTKSADAAKKMEAMRDALLNDDLR